VGVSRNQALAVRREGESRSALRQFLVVSWLAFQQDDFPLLGDVPDPSAPLPNSRCKPLPARRKSHAQASEPPRNSQGGNFLARRTIPDKDGGLLLTNPA